MKTWEQDNSLEDELASQVRVRYEEDLLAEKCRSDKYPLWNKVDLERLRPSRERTGYKSGDRSDIYGNGPSEEIKEILKDRKDRHRKYNYAKKTDEDGNTKDLNDRLYTETPLSQTNLPYLEALRLQKKDSPWGYVYRKLVSSNVDQENRLKVEHRPLRYVRGITNNFLYTPLNKHTATRGIDLLNSKNAIDKWDLWQDCLESFARAKENYDPESSDSEATFSSFAWKWAYNQLFDMVESQFYEVTDKDLDWKQEHIYPTLKGTSVRKGKREEQKDKIGLQKERDQITQDSLGFGDPAKRLRRWWLIETLNDRQSEDYKRIYGTYKDLLTQDHKTEKEDIAEELGITPEYERALRRQINLELRQKYPSLVVGKPPGTKSGSYHISPVNGYHFILHDIDTEFEKIDDKKFEDFYHYQTKSKQKVDKRWNQVLKKRKEETKAGKYFGPWPKGRDGRELIYANNTKFHTDTDAYQRPYFQNNLKWRKTWKGICSNTKEYVQLKWCKRLGFD